MGSTSDRFDSEINEIREKIAIEEDKLKDVKSKFDEKANICERLPDNRAREIIEDGMLELSRQINNHKENIQKYEQRIMAILRKEAGRLRSIDGAQTTEKQTTQKTPAKDIDLFYDANDRILFLDCKKKCTLTKKEQVLFDYLKKDGYQDVMEICGHMKYTYRNSLDPFISKLNRKTNACLGFKVIKNIEKGGGKYEILPKVKDGNFKKQDSGKMKARQERLIKKPQNTSKINGFKMM